MSHSNSMNEHCDGINLSHGVNQSFIDQLLANISNTTCASLILDSQAIGAGVFLSVFILFAIIGNILVILSVLCNRHLQTVTNFFHYKPGDSRFVTEHNCASIFSMFRGARVLDFGRVFCNIWAAVDVLCCTASILSLCVISIDRYIGVKYSLKYPTLMTEKKAGVILVVVWVSSMAISIGPLLGWKEPLPSDESICSITQEPGYALFSSLFSFYLPLMVILVMYFRIYVVARRTTESLEAGVKKEGSKSMEVVLRIHCRSVLEESAVSARSKTHPFRSSLSVRLMKFSREKRAAKTLGIVVGVFILCWLPFFLVLPLGSLFPSLKPSDLVFKVIFWLGYFNSCVNPIIYPCSSKEFKRAFIRLLKCQCHRRWRTRWRFYDQRWRTSMNSSRQYTSGDYKPRFSFSFNNSFLYRENGRTPSLKGWNLFTPLQKSSFQLKEKMNNLSNKIKNGPSKSSAHTLGKVDVDSLSMRICNDHRGHECCDPTHYDSLKETHI